MFFLRGSQRETTISRHAISNLPPFRTRRKADEKQRSLLCLHIKKNESRVVGFFGASGGIRPPYIWCKMQIQSESDCFCPYSVQINRENPRSITKLANPMICLSTCPWTVTTPAHNALEISSWNLEQITHRVLEGRKRPNVIYLEARNIEDILRKRKQTQNCRGAHTKGGGCCYDGKMSVRGSFWGQPCETHKKRDWVFESRLVMWFTIPFLRRYRVLPWKTKLLLWSRRTTNRMLNWQCWKRSIRMKF